MASFTTSEAWERHVGAAPVSDDLFRAPPDERDIDAGGASLVGLLVSYRAHGDPGTTKLLVKRSENLPPPAAGDAAFGATPAQNMPPVLRRHTGSETMGSFAFEVARLKRSFHSRLDPYRGPSKSC